MLWSLLHFIGVCLALIVAGIGIIWVAAVLLLDLPTSAKTRRAVAIIWSIAAVALLIFLRPFSLAFFIVAALVALIALWWRSLRPLQERDWKPQVALLPHAVIEGDLVTIHNVRNFDYRSETDFTPRYETRTYDLRQLRGLDLFLTYWSSPWMAHPILSFDFGEGGHVCFSIETRQQLHEGYSAVGGFFRQYELVYVAADERDAIRLRTNFRPKNEVYLYRLTTPPEQPRGYFLDYVRRLNQLQTRPEWYNALTNNCTTNIRTQRAATQRFPWNWRVLVNGYADELLYERGALDRMLPFSELKRRAHINERARRANAAPDFSVRIRMPQESDLPGEAAESPSLPVSR